jgi:hypothetical protein
MEQHADHQRLSNHADHQHLSNQWFVAILVVYFSLFISRFIYIYNERLSTKDIGNIGLH